MVWLKIVLLLLTRSRGRGKYVLYVNHHYFSTKVSSVLFFVVWMTMI